MIDADLKARIRRMYYVEHWKRGTIATQLGVHFGHYENRQNNRDVFHCEHS